MEKKFAYDEATVFEDTFMTWAYQPIKFWSKNPPSPSNVIKIPSRLKFETSIEKLESEWGKEIKLKHPSFYKALWRAVGWDYLRYCLVGIVGFNLGLVQAVILICLVDYINDDGASVWDGLIFASLFAITTFFSFYIFHWAHFKVRLLISRVKAIVPYIIYKKVLKTSFSEISQGDYKGTVPSLIAAELEFLHGLVPTMMILAAPVFFIGSFLIIWFLIGWTGILGLVIAIIHSPILLLNSRRTEKYRGRVAAHTDRRLKMIANLIEGIRAVKLYGMEDQYLKIIYDERRGETQEKFNMYGVYATIVTIAATGIALTLLVTFSSYVYTGNKLETEKLFCVVTILLLNCFLSCKMSDLSFFTLIMIKSTMERITKIMLLSEKMYYDNSDDSKDLAISAENATFSYSNKSPKNEESENSSKSLLKDEKTDDIAISSLNFSLKQGEFMIVIGPIGSGKSSLLLGLLHEIYPLNGIVNYKGNFSYTGQNPWIISGSIKQNILMDNEYKEEVYNEAVKACGLDMDLSQLPSGDETLIGDNGATLSGGQKARISLARAVYANKDIILLDDPLSAVDTQVGSHIFNQCIKTFLKGKTVILVTHQVHTISQADKILVLNQGKQLFFGACEELNSREDLHFIIDELKQKDEKEQDSRKMGVDEIKSTEKGEKAIVLQGDEKALEDVTFATYYKFLKFGFTSMWSFGLLAAIVVLTQAVCSAPVLWLVIWTKESDDDQDEMINLWIFCAIVFTVYLFIYIRYWVLVYGITKGGEKLHNKALEGIAKTESVYFDKNPSGRMLNRFSKDTFLMDECFSFFFPTFLFDSIDFISVLVIISIFILPDIGLVLLYIWYVIWLSKKLVPITKALREIELASKSPILTMAYATLYGIVTIRSLSLQKKFTSDMKAAIEYNLRCNISVELIVRFYTIHVALGAALICVLNGFVIVLYKDYVDESLAAMCICLLIAWVIYCFWSECLIESNNLMASPQRLMEYAELPPEGEFENDVPFTISKGKIEIKDLSMKYQENLPYSLHDLNILINPGQKVGIIGRTGSGKTSIMQVLFRLVNPSVGTIFIDDQDYRNVSLHNLRRKMSVIPQFPVIFISSFRDNIDPFHEHSDQEVLKACKRAHLSKLIASLPNGLNTIFTGDNVSLSEGEKQLVCLARVFIRNNKIVVMDEATSNVDHKTDKIIHNKINNKFKDCTLLIIAHRLRTIVDSDMIIVMEEGTCKEIGSPKELAEKEDSLFRNFIMHTGREESQYLFRKLNV
ncbi:unnamed protein product [Blepharisma stoltei]|uniref:Uncharacterized protein n=1 Tax=Blepharisma stoltei TaxID=1481888 RepID=A0AAU9K9D0_9CILI|nr:unnamed protein product [Blepharisma stoltei]